MSNSNTPSTSKERPPRSAHTAKPNPNAFGLNSKANAETDRKLAGHVCTPTCTHAGATKDA